LASGRRQDADLGLGHRKERLAVTGYVVRTRVDLPRNPRMHLAIAIEQTVRPDQAGRVEDVSRIVVIPFEKARGLDVDAVLPGLVVVAVRMLVGDRHGEAVEQFIDPPVDWRR